MPAWEIELGDAADRGIRRLRIIAGMMSSVDIQAWPSEQEGISKNPPFPAMEAKHGAAFGQGAQHCKRWAELSVEQAKEAEALAAMHEEMAKAAEQK